MTIAIMQPYFMPYIGYFQLIKAVDKFIIYDDVNFISRGWINRNHIIIGKRKHMFTIHLNKASCNKFINEIEIGDDFKKFIKTLEINYNKAPYFKEVITLIKECTNYPDKNLGAFITNSIKKILSYLQVNTEILISSKTKKDNSLKGQDKIISICQHIPADAYVNSIGGEHLYDKDIFSQNGIRLFFLKSEIMPYKQNSNDFIPNLSIMDILMFNSVEEVNNLLDNYILI